MWHFSISKWCKFFLHNWATVLVIFLLICGGAILSIWLLLKPVCYVTGAIRIAPTLSEIVATDRGISDYESYMAAQVKKLTSNLVIKKVEDDLADSNLRFSEDLQLKQAILDGTITVEPIQRSELIKVTMKSGNPEEARQVVDTFIEAYVETEIISAGENQNKQLEVEQKHPARISKHYNAEISFIRDNRIKYTISIVCSAIVCSVFWIILVMATNALSHRPVNNLA